MAGSLFLSLDKALTFSPGQDGELILSSAQGKAVFRHLAPGTLAALQRLGTSGEHEDCLADLVLQTDGVEALARFYYVLQKLTPGNLLIRSARWKGEPLATLLPISTSFIFPCRNIIPERKYVLSRFACMHQEGGKSILESPLAHARIVLHDWRAAALLHLLAEPRGVIELAAQIPNLPLDAAAQLMTLLTNAEALSEVNEIGDCAEQNNPALQSWEFHDLLFHARSRLGRHDIPAGGTYRFVGQLAPPPALKPVHAGEGLPLDRPDLARLERDDPPYAWVQETRRSIRDYAQQPISARQLGEFLYRVGRVKRYWKAEVPTDCGPVPMDFATRPYPGGGALYELELYPLIHACQGIPAGLYHYDPQNHRLESTSGGPADVEQLLLDASRSTGIPSERLQVLIILAARFQRLSWKYAAMAYSAILKHVGVVYQTMYLVATAMNLAPCGVGCGDSDLFARTAGTDYYAESSVGEFLLGSKR